MATLLDVVPMIAYEHGEAALDWLARVFGFVEQARIVREGTLVHGEMKVGERGLIMLATPSADYEGPLKHRSACERARRWSAVPWIIDGVLVYVPDVRTHFERAKREGATLLSELEEGPSGARYRVEDVEGHRWMFMQREPQ